jgi:Kef-type K+ transport system membrane component KefB
MIGSPASLFFLQVACILTASRAVGWVAARAGQPRVMAEMITGFLLGPSFFGWVAPDLSATLFPDASLPTLSLVSQIGLVLYMFCVGLEFRTDLVLQSGRRAVALSLSGIIGPLLLGVALAQVLRAYGGLYTDRVGPVHAALFTGTALSITAFPVLARIIGERGIAGTFIGSLALSAGAIDDALAWMLLAVVLGTLSGEAAPAVIAIGGGVCYAALVIWGVPKLNRLLPSTPMREGSPENGLPVALGMLMLGAYFTERIGMHAVFGAFLLGVSFRRSQFALELRKLVEPVAGTLFVPLFFAYAGLHTRLGLLTSAPLWGIAALIFITACVGKGLCCSLGAYWSGASAREALALATLMNTRGMVELILIDIGRAQGLITPTLYTMLVLMALGTTLMTGPLFGMIWQRSSSLTVDRDIVPAQGSR